MLTFITIAGGVLGILGTVVALVTRFNHVEHFGSDLVRHSAEIKDIYVKIDGINESMAQISADVKAMKAVCEERHRT